MMREAATVSVVMLTLNEAELISRTLSRLQWADEIIVVDSFSTDNTRELAAAAGAKVLTRAFRDFSDQSNWAMAQATGDWILIIDADEMATPELAESVRRTVRSNPSVDIFFLCLDSYVLGRRMRSSAWSGEWHPRLFRRGAVTYTGAVHQNPRIGGRPTGRLEGKLHHYTCRSMAQYFRKFELYTTLGAEKAHAEGRRASVPKAVAGALWRFFHNYFIRGGILDGATGFVFCVFAGMHVFVRHMKLWGLQNAERFGAVPDDGEKTDGTDGKG